MIASFFYLNPDLNGCFTQLVRRVSCGVLTAVCLASTMAQANDQISVGTVCLLYTSPSPRDATLSRMPSSA